MIAANLKVAKLWALTLVVISIQPIIHQSVGQVTGKCQSSRPADVCRLKLINNSSFGASDGDEQFQAYHQDIGRISGSSSQSAVAPQSIVRQLAPAAPATTPAPAPPPFERALASGRGRQPQQSQQQQQQRKPNRITLAVRTPAPTFVAPAIEQFAPPAAPQFAPAYTPPEPQGGAALNSFRSGLTNSVSARHSALMAQVAAERQSASASPLEQPSLGSPLEALSSPTAAQVQAPPALAASPALSFVDQPEEPLVAPSFEQILGKGCPPKGVFSYENKDHCDRYYMCTNGTFTEEACPNGLAYSQMGAVYQHCAYNWNVNCANKKTSEPLASPGCPWQFGIFPVSGVGRCSIDYFVCEWGVPETKRCSPEGLFYDDRIKGCQWADQLGCKSENLLNFKCPPEDEDNPYWPFPRYYHTKQDVIVCVNEQPRLVHCNEEQIVDPGSLACIDLKKKSKKKF